jgi:hypothetical protein
MSSPGADPERFASPQGYTPKHLAEKILTSKTALEGERKRSGPIPLAVLECGFWVDTSLVGRDQCRYLSKYA